MGMSEKCRITLKDIIKRNFHQKQNKKTKTNSNRYTCYLEAEDVLNEIRIHRTKQTRPDNQYYYSRTSMARTSLGSHTENCSRHWKFEPLKVNHGARSGSKYSDNLRNFYFLHNNCMLCVLIRIASSLRRF